MANYHLNTMAFILMLMLPTNMILDVEIKGMDKTGNFSVFTPGGDKCSIILHHNIYFLKEPLDYFRITVTQAKQKGSITTLSGTFEGKLHNSNGTLAVITDGRFSTISL
jgi:hypothetical protein